MLFVPTGQRFVLSYDQVISLLGTSPFIGARLKSVKQASDLKAAWGPNYDADMDLVTGRHAKAMSYDQQLAGRWALVATLLNLPREQPPLPCLARSTTQNGL